MQFAVALMIFFLLFLSLFKLIFNRVRAIKLTIKQRIIRAFSHLYLKHEIILRRKIKKIEDRKIIDRIIIT